MTPRLLERYRTEIHSKLASELGCQNPHQVPTLTKIVVNIALPRVRDFRGTSAKAFDGRGNYTLGIREQIIFPEIEYDKVEKITGMNVTICTTARRDDHARALLTHLGVPFRR